MTQEKNLTTEEEPITEGSKRNLTRTLSLRNLKNLKMLKSYTIFFFISRDIKRALKVK